MPRQRTQFARETKTVSRRRAGLRAPVCQKAGVEVLCVNVASPTEAVCPGRTKVGYASWMTWTLSSNRQALAGPLRMGSQPQHFTKRGPCSARNYAWLQGRCPFSRLQNCFPLCFSSWLPSSPMSAHPPYSRKESNSSVANKARPLFQVALPGLPGKG